MHFEILLFKKGKNATLAAEKICNIYEYDAILVRVAQRCIWFERFRSENFDLDVKIKIQLLEKSIKSWISIKN